MVSTMLSARTARTMHKEWPDWVAGLTPHTDPFSVPQTLKSTTTAFTRAIARVLESTKESATMSVLNTNQLKSALELAEPSSGRRDSSVRGQQDSS